METKPDTIRISASHREEIAADRADVFVSVKGSSLVSGDQALKKAREVSTLVEALTTAGIAADAIHLQGVHIDNASGGLLKTSSVSYALKFRCAKLDTLTEVLNVISQQKNVTLNTISWLYKDEEARERCLLTSLGKARDKAAKVAESLGVKLLGVYEFNEHNHDEEQHPRMAFAAQPMAMRAKSSGGGQPGFDLGMDIQHNKAISVGVDVCYRVSGY